ncbi:hypothetical protein EDB85DRAFT_1051599 [Lactarius pseudohatsudake]|nr:hypothetical protein EDB85DRAFT_1051599 [Lactarius pseudohatsudake]
MSDSAFSHSKRHTSFSCPGWLFRAAHNGSTAVLVGYLGMTAYALSSRHLNLTGFVVASECVLNDTLAVCRCEFSGYSFRMPSNAVRIKSNLGIELNWRFATNMDDQAQLIVDPRFHWIARLITSFLDTFTLQRYTWPRKQTQQYLRNRYRLDEEIFDLLELVFKDDAGVEAPQQPLPVFRPFHTSVAADNSQPHRALQRPHMKKHAALSRIISTFLNRRRADRLGDEGPARVRTP